MHAKLDRRHMLEAFYKIHDYLVARSHAPIRRLLMDEINWNDRLIAIKGARGVGKTDFLLARAKQLEENYALMLEQETSQRKRKSAEGRRICVYVNLSDFFFTDNSLVQFAAEFVKQGGRYLLLDQTFKYSNWSKELRRCHDKFKELHIIFTASPVMRLIEDNRDLAGIVKMYNLRGFSFREYLNLRTGKNFKAYKLEELMKSHISIATEICSRVRPLDYFFDYLRQGYYPAFLENINFEDELLKTMNMVLEVDVLLIKQIEVSNLAKLRSMLYQMLKDTPCALNISSLSDIIDTSRATTMNYIKYLKDARLLNLLYMEDKSFPMKPMKVYMQNTNLAYMISTRDLADQDIFETYFYNALHGGHKVNATERSAMFVIDKKWYFDVLENMPSRDSIRPCAVGNLEIGKGNYIPLWLLGFLY